MKPESRRSNFFRFHRPECSDSCRLKKQQLENEINKIRREYVAFEELKHNFEKQKQRYEQELRKMEQELRSREQQSNNDLMHLNELRMKNATLEKNLSAETRVKLDLFSALGSSKREVELRDCKSKFCIYLNFKSPKESSRKETTVKSKKKKEKKNR